ncbi:MAG: DUF3592 domain-containing protein, partial [Kiritimatiellae bacterium]|jgi:hypothetical protein|nr:DUF3592 domain-containing protein [Kiritimatiellia bacterium]
VVMIGLIGSMVWNSLRMSEWPTVSARVLEAKLERNTSSDSNSERAVARYSYQWQGVAYEGNRVAISRSADNIGSFQKRKADTLKHALRNNGSISVHVNPDDPSDSILYPELRWEMIVFYSVFGFSFGGVGFGILFGGLAASRRKKAEAECAALYPDAPWTWREDWAAGEIRSGGKTKAVVLTVFAIVLVLASIPVLLAFPSEFFEKGNNAMAIALVFPSVGLFLFAGAARAWIGYRKYGNCTLVLQEVPGVIGGALSGGVRIPSPVNAEDGFTMTLRCIRRVVTGSGKHRNTREHELWADSRRLKTGHISSDRSLTILPVLFHIPYECEPVDRDDSRNQVLWRLTVEARTPGVDFEAEFEVPVFKTARCDPVFEVVDSPLNAYLAPADDQALWREEHIRMEQTAGGIRLVFPMLRHKGYGLSLLIFTLVWWGITVGIHTFTNALVFFPAVFAIFGIFLGYGSIVVCLTRHVLDLRPGRLTLRGGLFGLKGPVTLSASDIRDLAATSISSQGKVSYYTLKAVDTGGNPHTLATQIKGRSHADELLNIIRARCGVQAE